MKLCHVLHVFWRRYINFFMHEIDNINIFYIKIYDYHKSMNNQ